jgi:hypothetical protein
MSSFMISFCPACSASWNPWAEKEEPVKCWSCGFMLDSITRMSEPEIEAVPESCPDHPKYKAVGKPATDCPTCWKMYKGAVDKQAGKVIENNHGA